MLLSPFHVPMLTRRCGTEYVCPKCGYFNPSARMLREIKEGKAPRSPETRVGGAAPPGANERGGFVPAAGAPTRAKSGSTPAPASSAAPDQDEVTSMDVDS